MKKIYYIVIISLMISSCKDDMEKANEDIKGIWKLESMQYEDSIGSIKVINDLDIKLIFKDDIIKGWDTGFQIIQNDTINFDYFVGSDYCNFILEQLDINTMPFGAIGRMQLYNFSKIDKKTIEFSDEWEYDAVNKKTIFNTSYLYTKLSN